VALVSAVVGGLLTAGAQLLVESRRLAHEQRLADEQGRRVRDLQEEESAAMARGAARLVSMRLAARLASFRNAQVTRTWWAELPMDVSPLGDEAVRVLAPRLPRATWLALIDAEAQTAALEQRRKHAEDVGVGRTMEPAQLESLKEAVEIIDRALGAIGDIT
jgi:hypothetical protein